MGCPDNIVQIKNLTIQFASKKGTVHAVNGLNLDIRRGRTTVIVGESGCGKTTTALSIGGLTPSTGGKVAGGSLLLDGEEILALPAGSLRAIRKHKISFIFQNPQMVLNPVLTVKKHLYECIPGKTAKEQETKKLLKLVGLDDGVLDKYPFELSGGMAQRLLIAMAVAPSPELIIADEPIVSLDRENQQKIVRLLINLINENHTSLLLITHDLSLALSIADYIAIMYAGQVVEYGKKEDIRKNPAHPYTKLLFQLFGAVNQKDDISPCGYADPPDPTVLREGCPFSPGCPQAFPICKTRLPDAVATGSESFVRCFRQGDQI